MGGGRVTRLFSPLFLNSFDFLEVTLDYHDGFGLEHQKSVAGVSVKKSRQDYCLVSRLVDSPCAEEYQE